MTSPHQSPTPPASAIEGPIPLVLGVTGHRQLPEDLEPLRVEVRSIFAQLRREYPHTPLKLLSPLADGADRLVAHLALEEGVGLIVVLAWPESACQERLHRSGSRSDFDDLLGPAEQIVSMPILESVRADELHESEDACEKQYAQVGAYIARHSQLLIALWDGVESPTGGTARVIKWQREGALAPFAFPVGHLDEVENGPVYQVTTPSDKPECAVAGVELKVHYPRGYASDEEAAREFHRIWLQIEGFNADASKGEPEPRAQVKESKRWILPEAEQQRLSPPLDYLLDRYARADAASLSFQDQTQKTLWLLFAAVVIAVVCFEFYTHLLVDVWPLLVAYIALLCVSVAWYRRAVSLGHHGKYLDYRALAEALRVQFFWRLAGLQDSVVNHYLRNLRSELDWIRQAIRSCNLVSGAHRAGVGEEDVLGLRERLMLVEKHWVDDQFDFFDKKAPMNQDRHQRFAFCSRAAFWTAIGLAILQLTLHLNVGHFSHALAVFIFLAAAAAALFHEYAEKQAFSVQAKRYDWMRSFFRTAQRKLGELLADDKLDAAQEVIKELGREALAENADWVLQRRQRPISPPH